MSLVRIYAYASVYIPHYFIIYVALLSVYRAYILRSMNYDKWWLGLIPFGHYFYRRDLGGVSLPLLIALGVSEIAGISGMVYAWFVAWILNAIVNMKFAQVYCCNSNPKVFGFVPFAKYILMWKEMRLCQK